MTGANTDSSLHSRLVFIIRIIWRVSAWSMRYSLWSVRSECSNFGILTRVAAWTKDQTHVIIVMFQVTGSSTDSFLRSRLVFIIRIIWCVSLFPRRIQFFDSWLTSWQVNCDILVIPSVRARFRMGLDTRSDQNVGRGPKRDQHLNFPETIFNFRFWFRFRFWSRSKNPTIEVLYCSGLKDISLLFVFGLFPVNCMNQFLIIH